MQSNYVPLHLHTELSLLDSCTNYKLYIDKAVEYGMKAICFTEHGVLYQWVAKKMYANSKGLKYLHGCEVYLTESLEPKVRDNYHTILIAKNYKGVQELNSLVGLATTESHFYYKPRISFDEFFNISDNIIKISACLASPLNKYRKSLIENPDSQTREILDKLLTAYDYYEIQPHVHSQEQKDYNRFLWEMSKKYNKPLSASNDTHSLDSYKAECRLILHKAKNIEYADEDTFDLTFHNYDELVDMFRQQNSLPMDVVLEAIENTNRIADMVEDFDLDLSFKYPKLADTPEEEDRMLVDRIRSMYRDKLSKGIIKYDPRYADNIREELKVFRKIDMMSYMLFMSQLMCWCHDNGIPSGYGRGSVAGSTVAFLTDITDVDPIVWNTVFSRFANESRTEIGDVDSDVSPSQRQLVYDHIISEYGEDKTAYILAIGTVSDKGTIDEIGRALKLPLPEVKDIKERYSAYTDAIDNANTEIQSIESQEGYENDSQLVTRLQKAREKLVKNTKDLDHLKNVKYKDLFYYFDGLKGTAISQSMHPAGIVISPVTLPDNYGCFIGKEGKLIINLTMDDIHEVSLVKFDILGLKTEEVIKDTCDLAHIPYPKSYTLNWHDENVWDHIADSPVGIFQFESQFAYDSLKKYQCRSVEDITLVTACIRPSGESYRNDVLSHKSHKNPSPMIDKLLEKNRGFMVYQEDTIRFLTDICGMNGSDADNVRRAIGRKQKDRLEAAMPEILDGYCSHSDRPREIAEQEAKEFLQVIEDSASYQFGFNHAISYSMNTYTCAYLRYYYPKEFITAYLNNANNEDDIKWGTDLAKRFHIPIHSIRFRHSTSQYSCDDTGIYKGISSIKFLNDEAANDLYSIKGERFDTFADLLKRITELRVDSRKLDILIKLDFFEEFGDADYLLNCNEIFNKYFGTKQLKKDKLLVDGVDFETVRAFSKKETPRMFTGINDMGLIRTLIADLPRKAHTPLQTKIKYQTECLGYIDIVDKKYAGYTVCMDVDTKYTPRVTLYALANGNTIPAKVTKKHFYSQEIHAGDILQVTDQMQRPKMTMVDGKWVEDPSTKEWWLLEYHFKRPQDLENISVGG